MIEKVMLWFKTRFSKKTEKLTVIVDEQPRFLKKTEKLTVVVDEQPIVVRNEYGDVLTLNKNGLKHSFDDKPARVNSEQKTKVWYKKGVIHRDNDKPAFVNEFLEAYYQDGLRHRDNDLPAVVHKDGAKEWFVKGLRMRTQDKNPTVITGDGSQLWHDPKGNLHNFDGPAVIAGDGTREWWINDKRHRLEGPAIIRPDGSTAYYVSGARITVICNSHCSAICKERND